MIVRMSTTVKALLFYGYYQRGNCAPGWDLMDEYEEVDATSEKYAEHCNVCSGSRVP